jgi:lipoprotein-releasing system ATP-binding protein
MSIILSAREISKDYQMAEQTLAVLKGIDLDIDQGEAICLLGSSGAGKSTLLQILGTLDRPTSGRLLFRDQSLMDMNDEDLSRFRNEKMGFVFQFHHLLQELSAIENVMLPGLVAGVDSKVLKLEAESLMKDLGLESRLDHFPSQMSGGELQRTAIARALIRKPQILFADEPTGNLDSENSKIIQNLFFQLQKKLGLTVVVVTHDLQFSQMFSKVYRVKDGRLT